MILKSVIHAVDHEFECVKKNYYSYGKELNNI